MFGIPSLFGFNKKMWYDQYAILIIGRKRMGKSTIQAMVAQQAIKAGKKVFSNYPIDGTIRIPTTLDKNGNVVMDKTFLYDNDLLKDSIVLLDEVSTIWDDRAWAKWSDDDSRFFNFLGKNNTRVFMANQYYKRLDLNVKQNIDATWFVEKSFWPNTSIVECDISDVRKVIDSQSIVMDGKYHKVNYEMCVIPDGRYYFRRKKWYPYFLTLYKEESIQKDWKLENWHDVAFKPPEPPDVTLESLLPPEPEETPTEPPAPSRNPLKRILSRTKLLLRAPTPKK